MSPDPRISVVIPSRRGPRLAFALEALAAQELDRAEFEVIVVVDELSEGSESAAPEGLEVRFLTATGAVGPTVKRNVGWRAAGAPLVAFTDDDCRPRPGWLAALLDAWDGGDALLQGATVVDPDEVHLLHGLARSQEVPVPSEWFQCANVAYPRALLERLSGFDEEFYFGGEDTDLGARALEAGARWRWVDEAIVDHAVIARTLLAALREAARWPSLPLVLARHPRYREAIHRRVFWNEFHAGVAGVALAAALVRRHPVLAAVAAAPWIRSRLAWSPSEGLRPLARRLVGLPPRLAVDAVETAATARAAIVEGVPVL
jgi:glycosyltransferase involved in cell wall biosynthesis